LEDAARTYRFLKWKVGLWSSTMDVSHKNPVVGSHRAEHIQTIIHVLQIIVDILQIIVDILQPIVDALQRLSKVNWCKFSNSIYRRHRDSGKA
jgi:hypothetical protein